MGVFVRIVERRSFTKAAEDLGLPRSTVTDAIKGLEARLGVKLLQRTTRHVSPTQDGELYYQRCVSVLADLEDAEHALAGGQPSGLIRVDVHGFQARHFLIPGLQAFLGAYPGVRLYLSETHRPVDLLREGVDCVIRAGALTDSTMIRRRIATLARGTFASPGYLARAGTPRSLADLAKHEMVGFMESDAAEVTPLAFLEGRAVRHVSLASRVIVTGPETNLMLACEGFGLVQLPRYRVVDELASGQLVEVLPQAPPPPMPVHVLYPHARQLSPRVRLLIDWMAEQYAAGLRDVPADAANDEA